MYKLSFENHLIFEILWSLQKITTNETETTLLKIALQNSLAVPIYIITKHHTFFSEYLRELNGLRDAEIYFISTCNFSLEFTVSSTNVFNKEVKLNSNLLCKVVAL